ncbi:GDSL esterase/lipase [Melia azedarach]|uniref:GDSL esterase/lipase n=1 Tax=Melia azedarach TaxID=155640 RepID=A0ACC1Y1U1_MELAZ|nr:GDSL esterase/lipase [Melia azedarach]
MARSSSSIFFLFSLVAILISTSCQAKSSELLKNNVAGLFIFGDSFLDAGNNNYINTTTLDQANFWPYGETYFKFSTGRFSDGRLVSDFIAEYANLPLIPPFLQPGIREYYSGVNFASAGAGALVESFQGDVINLRTQLIYYKKVESLLRGKLGNDEARMRISRAVFLFSIGSNDYTSPFLTNNFTLLHSFSESRYVAMVIGNLTTVIKQVYKSGGRKFAFMNVPQLGCLPVIRVINTENSGRCLGKLSLLAKLHNKVLSKLLFDLQKQLKGFKYSLFDLNSSLGKRMNHPSKYGFKEGKAACCGTGKFRGVFSCGGKRLVKEFQLCENPNQYVFWDSIHLTEIANRQLAKEMWNGATNSHVIGPYNLKRLFQIP